MQVAGAGAGAGAERFAVRCGAGPNLNGRRQEEGRGQRAHAWELVTCHLVTCHLVSSSSSSSLNSSSRES